MKCKKCGNTKKQVQIQCPDDMPGCLVDHSKPICSNCEIPGHVQIGWNVDPCPHQWFEIRKVVKGQDVFQAKAKDRSIRELSINGQHLKHQDLAKKYIKNGVFLICANCEEQKTIWEK